MPATKRPENPLELLKSLEKRVRILEQTSRLSSFIGALCIKQSNQSIASTLGTLTKLTFGTFSFDTNGFFNNGADQLIVPTGFAGYYRVYGKTEWENGTGQVRSRLRLNGSGFTEALADSVGSTPDTTQETAVTLYLNEGDTMELAVAHNQGTNRNVVGTGDEMGTFLGYHFLGM